MLVKRKFWGAFGGMARRPTHPSKEIEQAVAYAEGMGWRWRAATSHAWGRLLCSHNQPGGCQLSVNSTPRNPFDHARQIRRKVDKCPH